METYRKEKETNRDSEMDALQRSAGITRLQSVTNDKVLRQIGLQDSIIFFIERKQLIWYMAVLRLPKEVASKWIPVHQKKTSRLTKT